MLIIRCRGGRCAIKPSITREQFEAFLVELCGSVLFHHAGARAWCGVGDMWREQRVEDESVQVRVRDREVAREFVE